MNIDLTPHPLRWNDYVLVHGTSLDKFWQQHLASQERAILLILVKGFDPRMCLGLEMLLRQQAAKRIDVALIEYEEGTNSPSHEYRSLVQENISRLHSLIGEHGTIRSFPISIRSADGRRVASTSALHVFSGFNELAGYTDIVFDISSAPRGIYLPLAAKILFLLDSASDSERKPNFHLLVWENSSLDASIQDQGVEEAADYIAPFRGGMDLEATADQPKVWIPLLGEHQRPQLERIYDRVSPDEICPVLPSPARNPRRGDNLVADYYDLLFDAWHVAPGNFIYGSEQNPFEVYRQITRAINLYRDSFAPIGRAKFVLSALSSKLLSVSALLVAYDFKSHQFEVGIAHVDCQGYSIDPVPNGATGELFGLWLAGECCGG